MGAVGMWSFSMTLIRYRHVLSGILRLSFAPVSQSRAVKSVDRADQVKQAVQHRRQYDAVVTTGDYLLHHNAACGPNDGKVQVGWYFTLVVSYPHDQLCIGVLI